MRRGYIQAVCLNCCVAFGTPRSYEKEVVFQAVVSRNKTSSVDVRYCPVTSINGAIDCTRQVGLFA